MALLRGRCGVLVSIWKSRSSFSAMELHKVTAALETIAPTSLAEKWDNVGLLVEPSPPHFVERVLLTNDLTEEVMQESVNAKANMIVSYHPPIFQPLKRITDRSWKERIVIRALENKIAIYSPHTACDAVQNGVNDWLASGLGQISSTQPISAKTELTPGGLLLCDNVKKDNIARLVLENKYSYKTMHSNDSSTLVHCETGDAHQIFEHMNEYGVVNTGIKLFTPSESPIPQTGAGRLCHLKEPIPLKKLIQNVKDHLGLDHLRLAIAKGESDDALIKNIALCAGSGASVLSGCKADLYLTGEMSHHEVLDATQNGISVILCEHSNSERGYLNELKNKLGEILESQNLDVMISEKDKDPLKVV